MNLRVIINNSSVFTDEKFKDADLLSIANKGISRINTECNTKFPFYTSVIDNYTHIPQSWQYDLISTYLSYGIKMNDSSLTEANMYLDEFYRILNAFKDSIGTLIERYNSGDIANGIAPEYIETVGFGGVYGIDTSGAINVGFFGSNSNGGSF